MLSIDNHENDLWYEDSSDNPLVSERPVEKTDEIIISFFEAFFYRFDIFYFAFPVYCPEMGYVWPWRNKKDQGHEDIPYNDGIFYGCYIDTVICNPDTESW